MRVLADFLALIWRFSKAKTALFMALSLLSSVTEGIGLLLLVPLLGALQAEADQSGLGGVIVEALTRVGIDVSVTSLMVVFMVLLVARSGIMYLHSVLTMQLQQDVVHGLRVESFAAVMAARWSWVSGLRKSDQSNLLTNEVQRVWGGLTAALALPMTVLMVLAYLVAALLLSFKVTLLALLVGGALSLVFRAQYRRSTMLGQAMTRSQQSMQRALQEGLAGAKLMKILGTEARQVQDYERTTRELKDQQLAFTKMNSRITAMFEILVAVFLVAVVWLGYGVFQLDFATLVMFVVILARLAPMLRKLQNSANRLLFVAPSMQRFRALKAEAEAHADLPERGAGVAAEVTLETAVELRNVSYTYDARDTPSLHDVTLRIPARRVTAIMGPSGAGKTTLSDILMGLIEPDQGAVFVDGAALAPESLRAWRGAVAYVPQDGFLFNDSIRANLVWAAPEASEAEIAAALEQAAAGFVLDLPHGLDTVVGDGGVMLSGGERQRIALARAMLRDPALIILDEATSALDPENEAHISRSIRALKGKRTVVLIGHRGAVLEEAEHVILLEDGQVAAEGGWAEVKPT